MLCTTLITTHGPGRVDHRQLSDAQRKRPRPALAVVSCTEPEFLLAASVPANSCTAARCHGRTTHQPEDVPYGRFGPDLPCYPPLSHASSKFEVDGRTNSGVPSSPQVVVPHCSKGSSARFSTPTTSVWPAHLQSSHSSAGCFDAFRGPLSGDLCFWLGTPCDFVLEICKPI